MRRPRAWFTPSGRTTMTAMSDCRPGRAWASKSTKRNLSGYQKCHPSGSASCLQFVHELEKAVVPPGIPSMGKTIPQSVSQENLEKDVALPEPPPLTNVLLRSLGRTSLTLEFSETPEQGVACDH